MAAQAIFSDINFCMIFWHIFVVLGHLSAFTELPFDQYNGNWPYNEQQVAKNLNPSPAAAQNSANI